MGKIVIRDACIADMFEIEPLLRKVDVEEARVASGKDLLESLIFGVNTSVKCKFARAEDGRPLCVFGVTRQTVLGSTGVIWMVGTDLMNQYSRQFLRQCRNDIDKITKGFKIVHNYCDARNSITMRWLLWLGFTIEDAQPYGRYGMPFHHFWRKS